MALTPVGGGNGDGANAVLVAALQSPDCLLCLFCLFGYVNEFGVTSLFLMCDLLGSDKDGPNAVLVAALQSPDCILCSFYSFS